MFCWTLDFSDNIVATPYIYFPVPVAIIVVCLFGLSVCLVTLARLVQRDLVPNSVQPPDVTFWGIAMNMHRGPWPGKWLLIWERE